MTVLFSILSGTSRGEQRALPEEQEARERRCRAELDFTTLELGRHCVQLGMTPRGVESAFLEAERLSKNLES